MSKSKERCILPGLHYEEKPGKNFLLENIKKLREIQRETQRKLASQNQPNYCYSNYKKVPDLKIRSYQKRNKSEADLGVDSENPSLKSRLSTPVTAMASLKPVKNQKMQTVATEKVNKGRVIQARGSAEPVIRKIEKKPNVKAPSIVRSASVPSFSVGSETECDPPIPVTDESSAKKLNQEMLEKLINGEKKDFVTYNTYRAYQEKVKPKKPDPIKPPPNYRMGEVPKYLQLSKKELRSVIGGSGDADQTKSECPGYIMLSDRERKDHLEEFKKSYSELICKLRNIPLSSDSYSNRQRKMHVEKELEKLEDLMKLFSRGRLFIKV
uniref:Enkurin domain-containing protein n=2 Tax=Lygus hesperus TaxID=30085 RepID=A0A0A9ZFU7_LYGHE